MCRRHTICRNRHVAGEVIRSIASQPQSARGDEQLRDPGLVDLGQGSAVERREVQLAQVEVDLAAVVGVDERLFPQLAALVHVGHSGDGELDELGRERVAPARGGDPRKERLDESDDYGVVERAVDERVHPLLEVLVGRSPGGRVAGFARGLLGIRVQPLSRDRPGSDRGLPEEGLEGPVAQVDLGAEGEQGVPPLGGDLGEHVDPRPHVLAALGVVGGHGGHRRRQAREPTLLPVVELGRVD